MAAGPPLDNQLPLSKGTVMVWLGFACGRAVLNDDNPGFASLLYLSRLSISNSVSLASIEEVTYEVLE